MSVTRPMAKMAGWTKALRRGQVITPLEFERRRASSVPSRAR